jgi:hypothetical protein
VNHRPRNREKVVYASVITKPSVITWSPY